MVVVTLADPLSDARYDTCYIYHTGSTFRSQYLGLPTNHRTVGIPYVFHVRYRYMPGIEVQGFPLRGRHYFGRGGDAK